jgi:HD-GYP domain-containing protein (c-di-GMP phosphodiesterase class II)
VNILRLVSIHNCEEGFILAKPIYDQNSRILLSAGSVMNDSFIQRLKDKNVHHIYVKSEITEDVEVNDDLNPKLRFEAVQKLSDVFNTLQEGKTGKNAALGRVKSIRNMSDVFSQIMNEMNSSKHLLNLLSHMQSSVDSMFDHSINTGLYSLTMGRHIGLKEKELQILGLGALYHDIGKLQLEGVTKQSRKEWERHPDLAFQALRKESGLHLLVAHCAYQHHEHIDGSGFPRGLKGKDIHLYAKIIAVAEAFDYLINSKSMLPHEAMEVIVARTFTRYDHDVVEAFKNAIAIYPIGVTVILNTGETGVVIAYNNKYPQRPVIRVFKDRNGRKLNEFYNIDLMASLNTMIVKCDAVIEKEPVKS